MHGMLDERPLARCIHQFLNLCCARSLAQLQTLCFAPALLAWVIVEQGRNSLMQRPRHDPEASASKTPIKIWKESQRKKACSVAAFGLQVWGRYTDACGSTCGRLLCLQRQVPTLCSVCFLEVYYPQKLAGDRLPCNLYQLA